MSVSEEPGVSLDVVTLNHWSVVKPGEWIWAPYFTPEEMSDSVTGALSYCPLFMTWLCHLRYAFDKRMIITSAYRTPEHQESLPGNRKTGAHVDAQAVDVKCSRETAFRLMKIALAHDALGIGIHQNGDYDRRYLHIDRWTKAPLHVRPRVWDY